MIKRIQIENYKSIRKLDLELGRLNVFIGENGCGKTNILEAIALGSAAAQDRLSNEFLAPRGIRVTSPELMRAAFADERENSDSTYKTAQDSFRARSITIVLSPFAGRPATFHIHFEEDERGPLWINENPGGLSDGEVEAIVARIKLVGPDGAEVDAPRILSGLTLGVLARTSALEERTFLRVLAPDELVARVAAKLVSLIDPAFLALHADKFVFAIAVDEMECWLLPLLLDNDKAEKTTGCLAAANYELRRQKRDGLSSGETKFQRAYEKVARDFRKRKAVAAARKRSASLDAFVVDLERKCGLVLVAPTAD